jgi:hypothetical protein
MAAAITVLDLITEVLALMGEYSPGEPLDAAAIASLLFTLNGALDGLGGERLAIYSNSVLNYATVANKGAYTLGPDPANDWITPGPVPAVIRSVSMLSGALEIPIGDVSADEWARFGLKTLASSIASAVYVQLGPVSHTFNFWPIPSVSYTVNIYAAQQIPQFVAASDSVVLPPGYQEFLTYDLCIKSAAKFGATIPEWVPTAWREARTRIKERNFAAGALESRCDPALTHKSGRGWPSIDFYTGK